MVETVVTESLGLEECQAGTARTEGGEKTETLEHRALLDPGVGGSLTSGGAEPPAQTQRELNSSTLEELQEANIRILVGVATTNASQKSQKISLSVQALLITHLYMEQSMKWGETYHQQAFHCITTMFPV